MTFDSLRNNVVEAQKIIKELKRLGSSAKYADAREREFYNSHIKSLYSRLVMINNSIPVLLGNVSAVQKLEHENRDNTYVKPQEVQKFSYTSPSKNDESLITIKKDDKDKYLKELSLGEYNVKKLNQSKKEVDLNKPNKYAELSAKIFGSLSDKLATSGKFDDLKKDLRESNSRFLLPTYLSMAFFSTLLVFSITLVLAIALSFFVKSLVWLFFLPFLLPFFTLAGFYLVPSIEKSGVNGAITNELPFATIYMAAIAGSNIEPTKIFKIIANSPEYKNVGFEMRKVINQVEIYGYDLVNSLKNVAKSSPNKMLSELLNGMATNILSGGSLKSYLEKKADNLLIDYRLEREKYNALAGTFMDVYISVLITAPLLLVMLIVILGMTGLSGGLAGGMSTNAMVVVSIGIVILINILFMIVLQIKQPKI